MVVLLSTTIISCSQAIDLIRRLQKVSILNQEQKTAVIQEINKIIPSCPVIIHQDKK